MRVLKASVLVLSSVAILRPPLVSQRAIGVDLIPNAQPFPTVPPPQVTFQAPIGEVAPVPTPIPTIGPGQTFDEHTRPQVYSVHGDENFGWGEIVGQSGLVLVWMTDEAGTRYQVMSINSELFSGTFIRDPQGNVIGQLENGSEDLVEQRSGQGGILQQRDGAFSEGMGSTLAGSIVIAGLALCPETAGVGCIVGVIGGFAVAMGNAFRNLIRIQTINSQLEAVDDNLRGRFEQGLASPSP